MATTELVSIILCAVLALIMIVIGIVQLKKEEPASFYSGQRKYTKAEIENVAEWNQTHGLMWIIYGLVIIFCCCLGVWIGGTGWGWLPIVLGIVIPPCIMAWYHDSLEKKYLH